MPKIRFHAKLTAVGSEAILRLPEAASSRLPSRGMSMVEGTLNGHAFQAPLEPDGIGSHWFRVSDTMLRAAGAEVGDSVSVAVEPMALWPEPKVPADLRNALAADPEAHSLWRAITPMARWDWIRWIGSARQPATRRRRVENALDTPVRKAGDLLLQPQSMHRHFDVAQWRAARTNARHRRVRGAAGQIEKNLTRASVGGRPRVFALLKDNYFVLQRHS